MISFLDNESLDEFGFEDVAQGDPIEELEQCVQGCTHLR